jgi:hypothetical protein
MNRSPRARHAYRSVVAAVLIALAVAPLDAHDFWVTPSSYQPKVGALVGVRLLVGQDLLGDPVARDAGAIRQFLVATGSGTRPVPGRDGGDPAGILRIDRPGLLVVGYQSHPRAIALPPEKFDQYLGEEGLDGIRSILSARPKPATAHELFVRCAKSLLSAGEPSATDRDRVLGLTLELTAERNPYVTPAGEPLPFVLTYLGQPRPDALVVAISQRNPAEKLRGRTDRSGRVSFTFPSGGAWLVKAVHMIAAAGGSKADWESYWASTTFELADGHGSLARR